MVSVPTTTRFARGTRWYSTPTEKSSPRRASRGDDMVVADLDASLLPTSSGRRWLRARRPELYESLTRRTGQEQETMHQSLHREARARRRTVGDQACL